MFQLINITFGLCISVFTRHLLIELSSHYSIFSSLLVLIQEQILTKENFVSKRKYSNCFSVCVPDVQLSDARAEGHEVEAGEGSVVGAAGERVRGRGAEHVVQVNLRHQT